MPADLTPRGAADRRDASMQDHEVRNIAHRFNVTTDRVRDVIQQVGNDRKTVEAALSKR
jgi:hypothetical protein